MISDFIKKGALCAACLVTVMVCTIFSPEVQAAEEGGMTQPSSAKIYSGMSESSDIIANLIVGNGFEVLEAQNDSSGGIWYRIRTDFGAEGYVKAKEMDKLILDAQAMQLPTAADTGGEEQEPEGEAEHAGEESLPEENNAGEEPLPGENDAGEEPSPGENDAEENDAEEEPLPGENNAGEELSPGEDIAGENMASGENNSGEEPLPGENNAGEESVPDEDAMGEEPVSEAVSESDLIDGAGAGRVTGDQSAGSAMIGNEEFTVIERTEKPEIHRHGRIDAVLIMIIAGGILCIIAIAALLKRIMNCVRTEA